MSKLIKRLAAIAMSGMFAFSAVSFADFLACGSNEGVGIEDQTRQQPRRAR